MDTDNMTDEAKTKTQLITELAALRQRVSELEALMVEQEPIREQLQQEIAERQQAEETLKKERGLLRTLIDNLPDYIYVKDIQSRFMLANKTTLRTLDATTEAELIGKSDFDFLPPELAKQYYADEQALMQSGQPLINKEEPYIDRLTGKNGWLLTTKIPLRNSQGQIEGLVGMSRDITELKQSQETVTISRDTLQHLIEQLPIGIQIFDTTGQCIDANDAHLRIFGVSQPEQLIGKYNLFTDLMAEKTGTQAAGRQALTGEVVHLSEVPFDFSQADPKFADKEYGHRTISVTFFPVRNTDGDIIQIVTLNEDVTERKKVMETLQESEERYRSFFNNSPISLWEEDFSDVKAHLDGLRNTGVTDLRRYFEDHPQAVVECMAMMKVTDVNQATLELYQAESKEVFLGRLDREIFSEDSLDALIEELIAIDESIAQFEIETINRTFAGDKKYLLLTWSAAPGYEDTYAKVLVSLIDVTKRKEYELELARFRTILNQAGEAIFVTDVQTGHFIDVNETACRLLGYSREELLELGVADIEIGFPLETTSQWAARVEQIKQARESLFSKGLHRRKDGTTYPVELMLSHQGFESKNYILAVVRDVTEQKQLEERLYQAQRMEAVGQLAGGVAHNFNNILTAIMGYTGLSLETLPPNHPVASDLQGIQKTAERAAELVQQLMAFTRSQVVQPQILNINDLLLSIKTMLRQLISEAIELVILPASDLGQVRIDPSQFEQVIVNLILNARDAMPVGGKLTLETANVFLDQEYANQYADVTPGDYVMLGVSDTGKGMAEDVQRRVFEPFFTTKEVGQGTGLGLATCFGIVKQNNGHLAVYSEPGQGTTFKVYLPHIEQAPDKLSQPDQTQLLPTGSETILLVEDEETVREMAARILHQQGYTVFTAANGEDALQLITKQPKIDLLITDVVMPQMGGKILADNLKGVFPAMKVLYVSGYTDNAIVHHGVLEPGINFMPKPFTPNALARKVRSVLDEADDEP